MSNSLYIDENDITQLLDRVIHPDVRNRNQIIEYFTHLIKDKYNGSSMFMRVVLDLVPKRIYSIDDIIYVHRDRVYIGSYDFDKTFKAGFILAEDTNYIKCTVTGINLYQDSCYNIAVSRVQSDDIVDIYQTTASDAQIYHEKVVPAPGRLNVGDII